MKPETAPVGFLHRIPDATLRIGAVSFVAGLAAAVVFEPLHPSRQDPNNNPLVFTEYAYAGDWTTVHLGALAGALQVVDGVALKRAVDAWVTAPADGKGTAFAAAQAVRWAEYGLNALAFSLLGLTLVLVGVALVAGDRFPADRPAWPRPCLRSVSLPARPCLADTLPG